MDGIGYHKEASLRSQKAEEKQENDGHHNHSCRNLKCKHGYKCKKNSQCRFEHAIYFKTDSVQCLAITNSSINFVFFFCFFFRFTGWKI